MKDLYLAAYDSIAGRKEQKLPDWFWFIISVIAFLGLMLVFWLGGVRAEEIQLKASWYSVESLKKEGTFKYSKGVMANGKQFRDMALTCASCDYKLGTWLLIRSGNKSVKVQVTDRTNSRFKGKRIDLSKMAFLRLSKLEAGVIPVKVEVVK